MLISDASTRLRELGFRTPLEVVREAVQRLQNGESLYRLHSGEIPLVAKGTARKIKEFLDEGKLGFLFEIQPDLEAVRSVVNAVDADGTLESEYSLEMSRFQRRDTSFAAYYQAFQERIGEILSGEQRFDWNIEQLEAVGIPLDEALSLLVEHDILLTRRLEWTRSDLRRYLEISYIATCSELHADKIHKAPYDFIELAAAAWARGMADRSPFLLTTSLNIISYQVWRGPRFLEAFSQAQVATHRAAKRLKKQYEETIHRYLQLSPEGEFEQNPEKSEEQADG